MISFNKETEENQPDETILQESKTDFQLNLISELFEFYKFLYPIGRILDIYYKNRNSIEGQIETPLIVMKEGVTNLLKISNSFKGQLKTLVKSTEEPVSNTDIQERFVKAIHYFNEQTKTRISEPFKTLSFTTDNKAIEKDINKPLDTLEELLNGMEVPTWMKSKGLNSPPTNRNLH